MPARFVSRCAKPLGLVVLIAMAAGSGCDREEADSIVVGGPGALSQRSALSQSVFEIGDEIVERRRPEPDPDRVALFGDLHVHTTYSFDAFAMGTLATPDADRRRKSGVPELLPSDVVELEAHIDALEEELEPLKRFILPGGCAAAAAFHLARTVCRRAERRLVALGHQEPLDGPGLQYLNRLSDLLFVMARVENRRAGVPDIEWAGRQR